MEVYDIELINICEALVLAGVVLVSEVEFT